MTKVHSSKLHSATLEESKEIAAKTHGVEYCDREYSRSRRFQSREGALMMRVSLESAGGNRRLIPIELTPFQVALCHSNRTGGGWRSQITMIVATAVAQLRRHNGAQRAANQCFQELASREANDALQS